MKEPWMRKNRILAGILATGHNGEHHTEFQGTFNKAGKVELGEKA
jgi:hypothetical protein